MHLPQKTGQYAMADFHLHLYQPAICNTKSAIYPPHCYTASIINSQKNAKDHSYAPVSNRNITFDIPIAE